MKIDTLNKYKPNFRLLLVDIFIYVYVNKYYVGNDAFFTSPCIFLYGWLMGFCYANKLDFFGQYY